MSLQHFVAAQAWCSGRMTGSVITYPNPPPIVAPVFTFVPRTLTSLPSSSNFCHTTNWGEKIAITTSEMISWNVSSGTGIT